MAQFDLIDDSEEMEQAGTVDVLIPLGLDQAYSYAVPAGLVLKPGDVVQVPLGPRETVGVVWDIGSGRGGNLKKVTSKYDMPPLDPALMMTASARGDRDIGKLEALGVDRTRIIARPASAASSHRLSSGERTAPAQSPRAASWPMFNTPARVFTPVAMAVMVPAESGV